MSIPVRIQLSRKKGWRMPPNTVSVARPTKWGNPYWDTRRYGLSLCLTMFKETANGFWSASNVPNGPHREAWIEQLYRNHCDWMKRLKQTGPWHPVEAARSELRGKNLACWCSLDQPCHADILLEIANS